MLDCFEFTFSQGGPKLARRDQFWLPKLVRLDRFFVTVHYVTIIIIATYVTGFEKTRLPRTIINI